MTSLAEKPNLKAINAYKKKLTWGDVPAIYHLISSSLSELSGILSDGFNSGYKQVLDRNTWNLSPLGGHRDSNGNVHVKIKPQIILRHHYNDMGYELHCYPIIDGEKITQPLVHDNRCSFQVWLPQNMQMLFRINSLIAFAIFTYQSGDEADVALVKYAYHSVEELIKLLSESFDILTVEGYNIAEFYQEIDRRGGNILTSDYTQNTSQS